MNNTYKFTPSQIRYIIWMYRLSCGGCGVKNVELAAALDFSKPSVHYMLKSLTERGIVRRETFGLAHFTEEGALLAQKYTVCFRLIEKRISDLCGDSTASENAVCGLLADMPSAKLDELYQSQEAEE